MSTLRRVILVSVLLAVCAVGAPGATTLRISLPPVLEALPIAFANAWGMFDAEGLSVDVKGITESDDRLSAFVTGSLDAMMSDVTSAVIAGKNTRAAVIVASAGSTPPSGTFRLALVSYGGFGPADIESLLASSDRVRVMLQSDDEYVLSQFFAAHGVRHASVFRYADAISYVYLSLWLSGKSIPLGVLPEPYYSYITTLLPASGVPVPLIVLSDFSNCVLPPRVVLFHQDFINKHHEEVETFLRVYDAAVVRMNATPRDELVAVGTDAAIGLFFTGADKTTIQPQTLDAMTIPVFERPAPLSQEVYDSVTQWMADEGYLSGAPAPGFGEFTDFTLLP